MMLFFNELVQKSRTLCYDKKFKFNKKQKRKIASTIKIILEDSFRIIEPDAKTEEFYNSWSKICYKDLVKQQINEAKGMFSDVMNGVFGLDVDLSDIDGSPEGMAKAHEKLRIEIEKEKEQELSRKKTKKQLEREAALNLLGAASRNREG